MKTFFKSLIRWCWPGFVVWLTLASLNAGMYDAAYRDHKFAVDNNDILIPIFSFAASCAFLIGITTLFVYALIWLAKRITPRHYVALVVSTIVIMIVAIAIPLHSYSERKNIAVVSRDLGVKLPDETRTLQYEYNFGFDLDDYSCSRLEVTAPTFQALKLQLAKESEWHELKSEPERLWRRCLKNAPDFKNYELRTVVDFEETKFLIGFSSGQNIVLHAYSHRMLAREE